MKYKPGDRVKLSLSHMALRGDFGLRQTPLVPYGTVVSAVRRTVGDVAYLVNGDDGTIWEWDEANMESANPPTLLTYQQREKYACDVCGNAPNEYGEIEHGKGCYVVDDDGGGSTYVEFDDEPKPRPQL